jgi:hypothetical protein
MQVLQDDEEGLFELVNFIFEWYRVFFKISPRSRRRRVDCERITCVKCNI